MERIFPLLKYKTGTYLVIKGIASIQASLSGVCLRIGMIMTLEFLAAQGHFFDKLPSKIL